MKRSVVVFCRRGVGFEGESSSVGRDMAILFMMFVLVLMPGLMSEKGTRLSISVLLTVSWCHDGSISMFQATFNSQRNSKSEKAHICSPEDGI